MVAAGLGECDKKAMIGLQSFKEGHFRQTWQVCWIECDLRAAPLESGA